MGQGAPQRGACPEDEQPPDEGHGPPDGGQRADDAASRASQLAAGRRNPHRAHDRAVPDHGDRDVELGGAGFRIIPDGLAGPPFQGADDLRRSTRAGRDRTGGVEGRAAGHDHEELGVGRQGRKRAGGDRVAIEAPGHGCRGKGAGFGAQPGLEGGGGVVTGPVRQDETRGDERRQHQAEKGDRRAPAGGSGALQASNL